MSFLRVICGVFVSTLMFFSQTAFAISYKYDELGRLIEVTYDSGRIVSYAYDPAGNRTVHTIELSGELSINDSIATLGVGSNLIDLSGWPVGEAPAGVPNVAGWATSSTYYNETRWSRVTGPGDSQLVTTLEAGQTETDPNGGGINPTNYFTIDKTKAYEFSIYFRKHDLTVQNLYFGLTTGGIVKHISNNTVYTNPYFLAWSMGTQTTYLDPGKWYKIVAYVLPEGYPQESTNNWGGIFDVETGIKISNIVNFRWNENSSATQAFTRFFTYYSEAQQNRFTNYFYQPEVRVTDTSYIPYVPSLSITHANATEGSNITYNVNLSQATTVDVKVDYVVGAGSASTNDYTAISGTLVIPTGSTQGTITVNTTADSDIEPDETIQLTLTAPVRSTLAETTELATILTDDFPPSFSVNNISIAEGGNLTFTVTKTGTTGLSHNVTYTTANGSAVAGSDYTSKSGTLTFTSGQASQTVTVVTTGDSTYENNETLYLNLSNPTAGATIADSQGVGTVTNNDAGPAFSINNVSVTEGGVMTFTVTKSGSTVFNHNVNYATANGTAASGSDYTSISGTLSFTSAQTSKTVSVSSIQDSTYELNETLYLNLSSATSGATIADSQGVGIINNDDNRSPVAVNDSTSSTAYQYKTIYVLNNDSDPDGDSLTVTSVNNIFCWIETSSKVLCEFFSTGTRTVTYTISDGNGGTDSATITISVTGGGGGGGPF